MKSAAMRGAHTPDSFPSKQSMIEQAGRATAPLVTEADEELVTEAISPHFDVSRFFIPPDQEWALPRGASRHGAGPP
jgi:hypothetical protein